MSLSIHCETSGGGHFGIRCIKFTSGFTEMIIYLPSKSMSFVFMSSEIYRIINIIKQHKCFYVHMIVMLYYDKFILT